jgi:hypothetical protein
MEQENVQDVPVEPSAHEKVVELSAQADDVQDAANV